MDLVWEFKNCVWLNVARAPVNEFIHTALTMMFLPDYSDRWHQHMRVSLRTECVKEGWLDYTVLSFLWSGVFQWLLCLRVWGINFINSCAPSGFKSKEVSGMDLAYSIIGLVAILTGWGNEQIFHGK
jgi:hypothetical protein